MRFLFSRISFLILLFTTVSMASTAQVKNNTVPMDIRGRLVELAIQNAEMEVADHQINIAQYNAKADAAWLTDGIGLNFNLNEFTLKRMLHKENTNGAFYPYYPIYNFGVSVPIGKFFSQPSRVKAAKEQVEIAKNNRNTLFTKIKTTVLTTYEDYLARKELLTLQNQTTENSYNDYLQAKEKFRNGQISLTEFNIISSAYNNQLKNKIMAEHDLNVVVIQLEGMIGVSLNSVLDNPGK